MTKLVTVEFLYKNEIRESENMEGILLGDKVLVVDDGCELSLYNAVIFNNDEKVLVNLDANPVDFLEHNPEPLVK